MTVTELHPAKLTFADFWDACPLKKGKVDAMRAWDRATQPGGYVFKNREYEGEAYELHIETTPRVLCDAMAQFRAENVQTNPETGAWQLVTDPSKVLWPCRFISKGRFMDYE